MGDVRGNSRKEIKRGVCGERLEGISSEASKKIFEVNLWEIREDSREKCEKIQGLVRGKLKRKFEKNIRGNLRKIQEKTGRKFKRKFEEN